MAARLTDAQKATRALEKDAKTAAKKADRKAASDAKKTEKKAIKVAKKPTAKAEKTAARARVSDARKERKIVKAEIRTGEKTARKTHRDGNKGCRAKRKDAQAPHKDAIAKSRIDYDSCRRAVEGRTVGIVSDLVPYERRLVELNGMIPPPVPNRHAAVRTEQWGERVGAARAEVLARHPELAAFVDEQLGPLAKYGSKDSRAVRDRIDRPVNGRPAMRLEELLMQRAHEGGFSPTSGMRPGSDMQAGMAEAISRTTREMMEAGDPSSRRRRGAVDEILTQAGVSSTTVPSGHLPSSAFRFPLSAAPGAPIFPGGEADGALFAGPSLGSIVDQVLAAAEAAPPSAVRSSRRGAPVARRTREPRARGKGGSDRAPRTKASPGSKPRPKTKARP